MYFVYILQSQQDKSLYTGLTINIKERLKQHNNGLSGYTKSRMPWKLLWCSIFPNEHKAALFEKYLKTASGIAFLRKRLL